MTEDLRKAAEAAEKVAPGPWDADSERMDDAPDRHDEFVVFDGKGRRIMDTSRRRRSAYRLLSVCTLWPNS